MGDRGKRSFFAANLLRGVVRFARERKPNGQHIAKGVAGREIVEQRERDSPLALAGWREAQTRDPRAEQTVASLQMMIEKTQGTVGGQRRKPERQPCQLNRHGIAINAV